MSATPGFDLDLLRRYGELGPRYTSYPTAPRFHNGFAESELRRHARRSNAELIPRPISLYVHVPYCFSPCFYCGCNRLITRDPGKGEPYLERVLREIERVAPLFDRDREVVQVHFGGGTPNCLGPVQLGRLLGSLGRHFTFSEAADRDFSIELDPRHVGAADIEALARLGFNRASLGVQDFNPAVQRAVNRIQSVEQTLAVIDACRASGLRSVNVDLIYGLPKQTLAGFGDTLDTVIAARPDRLAVYGYAHLPQRFRAQNKIREMDLPDAEGRLALLALAVDKLTAAGYVYIGVDHFALPGDDLAKARGAVDIAAVERRFAIDFADYFAAECERLAQLERDGLVTADDETIRATSRGRYLLRIIAMCFDRYLQRAPRDDSRRRCSHVI